jgi:hypothetical protein
MAPLPGTGFFSIEGVRGLGGINKRGLGEVVASTRLLLPTTGMLSPARNPDDMRGQRGLCGAVFLGPASAKLLASD